MIFKLLNYCRKKIHMIIFFTIVLIGIETVSCFYFSKKTPQELSDYFLLPYGERYEKVENILNQKDHENVYESFFLIYKYSSQLKVPFENQIEFEEDFFSPEIRIAYELEDWCMGKKLQEKYPYRNLIKKTLVYGKEHLSKTVQIISKRAWKRCGF